MTSTTVPVSLALAMGLRPLDRLQVNSKFAQEQFIAGKRMGYTDTQQPFWYFQRVTSEGLFEVRSPGGYQDCIHPTDVCDIIPGEPIEIEAVPISRYSKWLARPRAKFNAPMGRSTSLWVT